MSEDVRHISTVDPAGVYGIELDQHPGVNIAYLWQECLRKVCDQALGRPFTDADAGRFQLLRLGQDYSKVLVAFDGQQIGTMSAEYVHRDGGVFYQVNFA